MGITIHYRGTIDRMEDTEEFEDRVIDIVHALGGQATVWRSFADHDPSRVIRGVMVEMAPGLETMSLLISPEGYIINLYEIERAEQQPFGEPPYCYVKTQYGSVFGHIAIVHLLDALKGTYFSNLSVFDEGGFYEERNPQELARKMGVTTGSMQDFRSVYQNFGLTNEASEDPEIVLERVRRVALLVNEKLKSTRTSLDSREAQRQDEKDPFTGIDDHEFSLEDQVDEEMRDYQRRIIRAERMMRQMREHQANGDDPFIAFRKALESEGIQPSELELESSSTNEFDDYDTLVQSDWNESEFPSDTDVENRSKLDDHPIIQTAQSLLVRLMGLEDHSAMPNSFLRTACNGLMEMLGGIVQAASLPRIHRGDRAYAIVQLHRALKGLAFYRGAVFGLLSTKMIDEEFGDELLKKHGVFLTETHQMLSELWEERID